MKNRVCTSFACTFAVASCMFIFGACDGGDSAGAPVVDSGSPPDGNQPDGKPQTTLPPPRWTALLGGAGSVTVHAAAVDPGDSIYVAIEATDGTVFGDLPPLSGGTIYDNGQLLKLSPEGKPLWVKQTGDAVAVVADGSGVVTSNQEYVSKRDANGAVIWSTNAYSNHAISAAAGAWLVGGSLYGRDVSIGTGTINGTSGSPWVAYLNPDGTFKAGVSLPGQAKVTALAVDSANNAYAAGYGRLDGSSSTFAVFIVKLDSALNVVWKKSFVGSGRACSDCRINLALAPQGRPVLAGRAPGAIDLGTGTLPGAGMFAAAFNEDGSTRWAHLHSTPSEDHVWYTSLAVTSDEIILGGTISDRIDLGGTSVGGGSPYGGFLAGLAHDGILHWARTISAHGDDSRVGAWLKALVSSSKDILAVGHLTHCPSSVDFGGKTEACAQPGSRNLFLGAFPH